MVNSAPATRSEAGGGTGHHHRPASTRCRSRFRSNLLLDVVSPKPDTVTPEDRPVVVPEPSPYLE